MWRVSPSCCTSRLHFYSHIPCGMWRCRCSSCVPCKKFLLTHPVWDVTHFNLPPCFFRQYFYSHIPCGMWRCFRNSFHAAACISTHTSRVGCDQVASANSRQKQNFYSHIPCGMWRLQQDEKTQQRKFLLTHPVWDVTRSLVGVTRGDMHFYSHIPCGMWRHLIHFDTLRQTISTHTSRVGCDPL